MKKVFTTLIIASGCTALMALRDYLKPYNPPHTMGRDVVITLVVFLFVGAFVAGKNN